MNVIRSLASLLCLLALSSLAGCGANGVGKGLPVVGVLEELDADGHAIRWMHTDGDITVARYDIRARVYAFDPVSGLTLPFAFYEHEAATGDAIVVLSRSLEFSNTYAIGAPLPHWLARWRGFRPGEAEQLGLVFLPPPQP